MNIIEEAIECLLLTQERWYSKYFLEMQRIESKDIPTIGTKYNEKNDVFELLWNKKYFESLSLAERVERLKHELLHIIFDIFGRISEGEIKIKNAAHDLAINQLLDKNLIKDGLLIENFPSFPTNECAEIYYKLLKSEKIKIEGNFGKVKTNNCGQICGRLELSLSEKTKSEKISKILNDKLKGDLPQEIENIIESSNGISALNWKQILRNEITNCTNREKRKTWKRFSRRFGEGWKGTTVKRIPKIIIGIDTSGSIKSECFISFVNEIKKIQKDYNSNITVIECDAKVHKIYELNKFKNVDTKFVGGGGTDFRPIFNECKKRQTNIFVFFTDTFGTFPIEKFMFKTLWCVLNKNVKVPFGKIIEIKNESKG